MRHEPFDSYRLHTNSEETKPHGVSSNIFHCLLLRTRGLTCTSPTLPGNPVHCFTRDDHQRGHISEHRLHWLHAGLQHGCRELACEDTILDTTFRLMGLLLNTPLLGTICLLGHSLLQKRHSLDERNGTLLTLRRNNLVQPCLKSRYMGRGILLGFCICCFIIFQLVRYYRHQQQSRLDQTRNIAALSGALGKTGKGEQSDRMVQGMMG